MGIVVVVCTSYARNVNALSILQSAYTTIREENTNEIWELHLKPSRDKSYVTLLFILDPQSHLDMSISSPGSNIFGYLCKHSEMKRIIREQQEGMLKLRRLPLVLDLDDTLVRLVGNEVGRYVPESVLNSCEYRSLE